MPRAERRPRPWGLFVAALVYVALRGLILHTAFDQTAMEMYELYPMGTLPEVLLAGYDLPLRLYYDNAAGQILTGLAAVPSYALFGATYLALKLVPALFGLGALALIWVFLDQNFSRRAANAGALLFALGPTTTVAKYSLMASGNHFENLAFTMLALVCFYRLQAAPPERRGRWLLAAGFTGGLALFVFLGAIIPVGLLALMHLGLRGWRGFLRDLRALLPAFLVGLAPLLVLNLTTSGRGLSFLQAKFGAGQKREHGVLERVAEFLFDELPRAGFFDPFLGLPARVANWIFVGAFALAWLAALAPALRGALGLARGALSAEPDPETARLRFRRARLTPLVLYLPLTALAFGLSDLRLGEHTAPIECAGYRYYLPTFLFGGLLLAVLWDAARDALSPAARRVGRLAFAAALATGLWNLGYVDWSFSNTGLGARYVGHNFVQAARGLTSPKNELDDEAVRGYADGLAPVHRHRIYTGIGFNRGGLQWIRRTKRGRGELDYLDLDELVAPWPADTHADVLRGAGTYLRFESMVSGRMALTVDVLDALAATGDPRAALVAEGASTNKDYPQAFLRTRKTLGDALVTLKDVSPAVQPGYARGAGLLCGRLWRRGITPEIAQVQDFLRAAPGALAAELLRGLGGGLADGGEAPELPADALQFVPAARRAALFEGFAARLVELYGAERARAVAAGLAPGVREPVAQALPD